MSAECGCIPGHRVLVTTGACEDCGMTEVEFLESGNRPCIPHRADAYCRACGGQCRDPDAIAALDGRQPLSLRPAFTGAGQTSFKPARHANRGPGK